MEKDRSKVTIDCLWGIDACQNLWPWMTSKQCVLWQTFVNFAWLLGRPERRVPYGLMFYPSCIFFLFRHSFSELNRPIALKLCHMIRIWPYFIIPLQQFGGRSPQKNWEPKTCKISVNFGPLQTLIANISGTAEDIQNRKTVRTMEIPPAFNEKSPVNLVH